MFRLSQLAHDRQPTAVQVSEAESTYTVPHAAGGSSIRVGIFSSWLTGLRDVR